MQYRRLANTDIMVSTVAFGCWAIVGGFNWGHQEEKDSLAALRAAYDAGINFFDSAEGYGGGRSEQLLAKGLSDVRDQIVIATKVSPRHFSPDELRAACERSLRYLNSDWIDLYQLHWPNRDIPIEETLGVLADLKQEGKIRAYGVSNFGRQDLDVCLTTDYSIASNQLAYNLLFRAIEHEILPLCVREGISVLCYSPLMQGLLTGKFASADDVPEDRARTRHYSSNRPQARHGEAGAEAETFAAVAQVQRLADDLGEPMADVALAWLLAQQGVTSVIVGGRNEDQARRNTHAAELKLPQETLQQLSSATAALKQKLGRSADMWQSESRIR
jgi:myo-inositol catabolism protein IolS